MLVYWKTIKNIVLEETQKDFLEYMIDTLECTLSKKFLKSIYRAIQEEAKEAFKKEKTQALSQVRCYSYFHFARLNVFKGNSEIYNGGHNKIK